MVVERYTVSCRDALLGVLEIDGEGRHRYLPDPEETARISRDVPLDPYLLTEHAAFGAPSFLGRHIERMKAFQMTEHTFHQDGLHLERIYALALEEAKAYRIRTEHSWGRDYGGSQCSEESETGYLEIAPEQILTENGHFDGVAVEVEVTEYNGHGERHEKGRKEIRLKDIGTGRGTVRDSYFYGDDDHTRWSETDYTLEKKPEA